jgi:hypothetical protein
LTWLSRNEFFFIDWDVGKGVFVDSKLIEEIANKVEDLVIESSEYEVELLHTNQGFFLWDVIVF